jgi:hypothetical protein
MVSHHFRLGYVAPLLFGIDSKLITPMLGGLVDYRREAENISSS